MESLKSVGSIIKWKAKYLNSSQAIFIYVALLYLLIMFQKNDFVLGGKGGNSLHRKEHNFILILCGGTGLQGSKQANEVGRQIRQAEVMIKSAVLFTKKRLHFHVIVDNRKLFGRLFNRTAVWPEIFRRKLRLSVHDVWYPEERQNMTSCTTERLFVADMFPSMDKAIYIDTDLIFMRPPEDLWSFFDDFSDIHISAMAPSMYHYGSERNKVPYYGETGLNADILLMHLGRMRNITDGWMGATMAIQDKYKKRIKLADQDILNILFSFYPDKLYELPCQWNYRAWLCSQGENKCLGAEENGVSILHGNGFTFVKKKEMKIQAVFEAFEHFQLGKDSLDQLYTQAVAGLTKVSLEDLPSKCKAVPGIDSILLREMERHVRSLRP